MPVGIKIQNPFPFFSLLLTIPSEFNSGLFHEGSLRTTAGRRLTGTSGWRRVLSPAYALLRNHSGSGLPYLRRSPC